jgi:hypothetical protein
VARHIFQACPVWICTQSNITQASYSPEYITAIIKNMMLTLRSIQFCHANNKQVRRLVHFWQNSQTSCACTINP